jgi:RNA polymerase sigma factor (TIGR02999 family)
MTLDSRTHFLALAARLMRQILVDHARHRRTAKRGGGVTAVALSDAPVVVQPVAVDLLALDEALDEMGTFDPRQRDLVELRYFAGLTTAEAATALNVSVATAERDWATAKAWLYERLSSRSS